MKIELNFRRIVLIFAIFIFSLKMVKAQTVPTAPPPLPEREISGIVKDAKGNAIPGANLKLTSSSDTVTTRTNDNGFFVFKKIKSASYTLEVKSLGHNIHVGKYLQNDAIPRIVMNPIILAEFSNEIEAVVFDGTPSITYKVDTIEYKAKDYVVRENARVDELIKKMEDFEVDKDGNVKHQGEDVKKAKINGKTYLGGQVNEAVQNLPAEIVDKIQVVDDYGDEAARTGIKSGDPEKILNIVTKTEKSVGNTLNLSGAAGNNERYESSLFATRINGNQTVGLNGRFNNTVTGVGNSSGGGGGGFSFGGGGGIAISDIISGLGGAGVVVNGGGSPTQGGSGGASGGTASSTNLSFSLRDKASKKIDYNLNYSLGTNKSNTTNISESQNFSSLGTTFAKNNNLSQNSGQNHSLNSEFEFNFNKKNYLRIQPNFTISNSDGSSANTVFQTGLIHQDQKSNNLNLSKSPSFGLSTFYQHIFNKPRRNISGNFSLSAGNRTNETQNEANIIYYVDDSDVVAKDSLVNRIVERSNKNFSLRSSISYVEPLTNNTQLEVNGQLNRNNYDTDATTSNILNDQRRFQIDSLSNIFNYSFTQARLSVNYRYGMSNTSRVKFSLGLAAVPTLLSGTKASAGTSTSRTGFNLIPIARFQYSWSSQKSIQLNYNGNATEPSFDQIQPVRDVSNVQNPVVGNPDLKASFRHSVNLNFNNYINRSKFNYSFRLGTTITENSISRNIVQIADEYNSFKNETRYVNLNGAYGVNGGYSFSKSFSNRKISISYSGNANYNHSLSMSNNLINTNDRWNLSQRLGPRFSPSEWFEINPALSYNYTTSENSLPTSNDSKTKNLALNLDGRVIVKKSWIFNYDLSKNFVSGVNANVTNNPFIINMSLNKEVWNRRGTISFQAYDILNQNNFVNRSVTDQSIVDTKSNTMSRYFMVRLGLRLQKWSGARNRTNGPIVRMGDGSFIRN